MLDENVYIVYNISSISLHGKMFKSFIFTILLNNIWIPLFYYFYKDSTLFYFDISGELSNRF